MANIERKVGEIFQFKSVKLRTERIVGNKNHCIGCYFENKDFLCINNDVWDEIGECRNEKRYDNNDVIFIKVNE